MKTASVLLGLLGFSTLAGCSWVQPRTADLADIETFEDGSRMVGSRSMGLAVRAPAETLSESGAHDGVLEIAWGQNVRHYVLVNSRTENVPASLEDKKADLDARFEGFRFVNGESFEGGYALTYNYRNANWEKKLGYYSFRTVEGKTYECFLDKGSHSMKGVEQAQALCSSLRKYDAPAAGGETKTAAR
ncbi:MAG: hypothetical protein HOV80_01290 [Polyangiaceae bacterium]|nr:hypothetical protein [Polyangiaceae bacterium]